MVWDQGTYEPETPDVGRARTAGEIKFELHGEKLRGGFVLVRTRGRDSRSWLLLKRRDEAAADGDIAETSPRSVLTQRLMAEIAFDEGGDVTTAAGADPAAAIRDLMGDPRTRDRKPKRKPKVWRSNR